MKNETANPPTPLPPLPIMDDTAQTPKCTIFPSLFGGEDVYNFPSISYKHRRQSAERLNINHSRLRDEIPAPGSSVTTDTSKAKTTMKN